MTETTDIRISEKPFHSKYNPPVHEPFAIDESREYRIVGIDRELLGWIKDSFTGKYAWVDIDNGAIPGQVRDAVRNFRAQTR